VNIVKMTGEERLSDEYSATEARIYRKVFARIIPLLMVSYIVAYIDRVNIGMAKLQFMQALQFDEAIFGLGAGLFFVGYLIFEVPSNLYMHRIGARATLSRIMVLWGILSVGMAFVTSPMQFYILRFALGAAEAGFFPGVIFYLSNWFPSSRRGRMTSIFTMGGAIAGIIGPPISGWLMASFAGMHGLEGWQIVFIYEGLPAVILGMFVLFCLPDAPAKAKWLSQTDKAFVERTLKAEAIAIKHHNFVSVLKEPKVYIAFLMWVSVLAGTSSVALWIPSVLKMVGFSDVRVIGMLAAIPFLLAVVAMYLVARHSDRKQERNWHLVCCVVLAGLALIGLGVLPTTHVTAVLLLTIAAAALWCATPIFWTIPPSFLRGSAAAGGVALISSGGALGGFISPIIIGSVTKATGSVLFGLAAVGTMLVAAATIFVVSNLLDRRSANLPSIRNKSNY
jgi:MFS family permease